MVAITFEQNDRQKTLKVEKRLPTQHTKNTKSFFKERLFLLRTF